MTQWVHLWYSCVARGKELFILGSHDTSSHHIGTYLELSGRTATGDESAVRRPGWYRWVRARSPGDEKIYLDCETGDEAGAPADAAWQPGAASPGHWPPQSGQDTGAVNIRVTEKTWHVTHRRRESVTSETLKIKLSTVTTRRRMVWRWVIIICHARYLFLEFNSSAQFKLSTCTSYKTVTTAVLWGSYSQLLKCILCKEDDIVTFLVLTLQHFTGPKIRCKNVQQNRNRCCATRERKYKSFLLIITPAVFKYHSVTSSATNYKPHCCLENEQQ